MLMEPESAPANNPNAASEKETKRAFKRRIGGAVLAAAVFTIAPIAIKAGAPKETPVIEIENPENDDSPEDNEDLAKSNLPAGTIYDEKGNILASPMDKVISVNPPDANVITPVKQTENSQTIVVPVAPTPENGGTTIVVPVGATPAENPFKKYTSSEAASVSTPESTPVVPETAPETVSNNWDGTTLDAYNGHIDGPTGDETYYNLPMDDIVDRMHRMGVEGEYWVREDGVKMLGPYVMVAADLKVHPRGSIVETSLGTGIVCDTGDFVKKHPNRLDIATNW